MFVSGCRLSARRRVYRARRGTAWRQASALQFPSTSRRRCHSALLPPRTARVLNPVTRFRESGELLRTLAADCIGRGAGLLRERGVNRAAILILLGDHFLILGRRAAASFEI